MDSGRNVILIPTDFSEACTNAIEHGVELAKNFNSDVYILHVLNKDTKVYLQKNKLKIEDLQHQLDEIVDSIKLQHDLEVRTEIKKGSIFNEINATAKEIEACMVVLGTHGKKGFQHIFGSHAMRIIMSSDVPVIVVQNRAYGCGYENIVFPVNESIEFEQKVDWAVKLAKVFNSKIHVYKYKETDPEIVSNINSKMLRKSTSLSTNVSMSRSPCSTKDGSADVKSVAIFCIFSLVIDMIGSIYNGKGACPAHRRDKARAGTSDQTVFCRSSDP